MDLESTPFCLNAQNNNINHSIRTDAFQLSSLASTASVMGTIQANVFEGWYASLLL
jgi:hypothetical protein